MKVIVAGSRDIPETREMVRMLEGLLDLLPEPPTELVSGACRGMDTVGEEWAFSKNVPVRRFRADWGSLGNKAGPIRNQQMAAYADACVVVRYPDSKGSKSMLDAANAAGLFTLDVCLERP